jgi:chromate transporter
MDPVGSESVTPAGSASPNGWIPDERTGAYSKEAIARPLGALALGQVFLSIGATAVGGLGPSLAVIERELIEKRRALTPDDVAEATAAARLLPGSALAQVVSFLGYRLGGWTGSIVATTAFLAPSLLAMILLGFLYDRVSMPSLLVPAAAGLKASVVGLLCATTIRLGRSMAGDPIRLVLAVAAFVFAGGLGFSPAALVIAAGLAGIAMFGPRAGAFFARRDGRRPRT